jgi:predicted nucleotidyltransferase
VTNKKALILTNHLDSFTGSEVVFLEVAEVLSKFNFQIYIYANFINKDFLEFIKNYNIIKFPYNQNILDFDFIWSQHNLLPLFIKNRFKNDSINFVSVNLSSYVKSEFRALKFIKDLEPITVTNSIESKMELINKGIKENRIFNFENASPNRFKNTKRTRSKLNNIIIISNHKVRELEDLKNIFLENNINFKHYGEQKESLWGGYERVDENILSDYDMCITTGKSVQYSILNKLPTYVYGPFGGPGFLNKNNFEKAAKYNFSGRGFNYKFSSEEIFSQIIQNYENSIIDADKIYEFSKFRYSLEDKISQLLTNKNSTNLKNFKLQHKFISILDKVFIFWTFVLLKNLKKIHILNILITEIENFKRHKRISKFIKSFYYLIPKKIRNYIKKLYYYFKK